MKGALWIACCTCLTWSSLSADDGYPPPTGLYGQAPLQQQAAPGSQMPEGQSYNPYQNSANYGQPPVQGYGYSDPYHYRDDRRSGNFNPFGVMNNMGTPFRNMFGSNRDYDRGYGGYGDYPPPHWGGQGYALPGPRFGYPPQPYSAPYSQGMTAPAAPYGGPGYPSDSGYGAVTQPEYQSEQPPSGPAQPGTYGYPFPHEQGSGQGGYPQPGSYGYPTQPEQNSGQAGYPQPGSYGYPAPPEQSGGQMGHTQPGSYGYPAPPEQSSGQMGYTQPGTYGYPAPPEQSSGETGYTQPSTYGHPAPPELERPQPGHDSFAPMPQQPPQGSSDSPQPPTDGYSFRDGFRYDQPLPQSGWRVPATQPTHPHQAADRQSQPVAPAVPAAPLPAPQAPAPMAPAPVAADSGSAPAPQTPNTEMAPGMLPNGQPPVFRPLTEEEQQQVEQASPDKG